MWAWLGLGSELSQTQKKLFLALVLLGLGLRLAYGAVRYRAELAHLTGNAFISSWEHDARYHVLIAKALDSGEGYVVYDLPGAKPIRYAGQPALFKAPLYQYFLAGLFSLSGFSFSLMFPVQALLGGLTAGLVGLITLRMWPHPAGAWFAGIAAAANPILVNSASQPYNENLFFFLFVAVVWVFLLWWERATFRRAALGGALIGLCMLTRENGSILLVSIGLLLLFEKRWETRVWAGYLVIAALTVAFVLPWTVKNWVKFHALVPVAAIVGVDFVEGNNECVAAEGIFIPYWAEGPCAEADKELRPLLADGRFDPRTPAAVRLDQASKRVALRFVMEHPSWYAKLAIRRLWTTLLPYDPRGSQRRHERLVLTAYWLLVYPAGMMGLLRAPKGPAAKFLVLLICLSLASIMAVLYWSDLRFRVGIDLLLGCFAGWAWMQVVVGRRPKPLAIERV